MFKDGKGGYIRFMANISDISRDIVNSSVLIYKMFRDIKDHNLNIAPNDRTLANIQLQYFGTDYQAFYRKTDFIEFEEYMDKIFSGK